MVLSPLRASIATLAFIVPLKFFRILVIGFHLFNQSSTKRLPTLNACLNFGVHYTMEYLYGGHNKKQTEKISYVVCTHVSPAINTTIQVKKVHFKRSYNSEL